jgi:hypothetical protein
MNTAQLPSRFEAEIIETEVLYRKCFRHLVAIRSNPQKLRQASNALAEISGRWGEEDADDE